MKFQYVVLEGNLELIQARVERYLNEGWDFVRGSTLVVSPGNPEYFYRELVKAVNRTQA